MHLAFADSEARNLARVDVMNQGCRLDTANRANLNFETLRELQYNSTNHLDIDSDFLKNEPVVDFRALVCLFVGVLLIQ